MLIILIYAQIKEIKSLAIKKKDLVSGALVWPNLKLQKS